MNAMKLLLALGNGKGDYILTADFHQGKAHPVSLWLIAAVIALSALLVGSAVACGTWPLGRRTRNMMTAPPRPSPCSPSRVSRAPPGYQATREWYEWLEGYDQDMTVYHSEEAFSEDFGEEYWAYSLYSREMKDKLDEICQKYNLELLGKQYVDPDIAAGCQAIGIPGIFRPGAQGSAYWREICYYANGAFWLEGHVTLEGQIDRIVLCRCHRKSAFSDLAASARREPGRSGRIPPPTAWRC